MIHHAAIMVLSDTQLGWTAQLIYNSTGGRVPKFWRPPYGDVDNRVRAIATEVRRAKTSVSIA